MNKSDIKLVIILCLISFIGVFAFKFFSKEGENALVYYDGKLIKTIDLSVDSDYVVNGENGDVLVNVKDGKIKVNDENSPLHLCSKQGYISESYESIVCLPNRIVININSDDYDAVVK